MTTVLALRALGLGDTYAVVPALRGIRRALPGARLVLAGPPDWATLLAEQDVIDAVVPAAGLEDLAWEAPAPTVAVNLHGCGPESHRLLERLEPGRLVGFACDAAGFTHGPQWDAHEHEVERWIRLVEAMGGRATVDDLRLQPPEGPTLHAGGVVIHPGASSGSRRWPVDRWAVVGRNLAGRGCTVVVTGGPDETQLTSALASTVPGALDLGGSLTARELAQLVAGARLLLSADTGVAHLATAYRTPSVTLFGPTSPDLWGPAVDLPLHRVVWRGDSGEAGQVPGDPHGDAVDPRLAAVTPSDVLAEAVTALESTTGARTRGTS